MLEWMISIYVEVLILFIFFLGEPGTPVTPQLSPDDVVDSVSSPRAREPYGDEPNIANSASNTHDPLPMRTQSGGLNLSVLDNRARGNSPQPLPRENYDNNPNPVRGGPSSSPPQSIPPESEVHTSSPPSLHTECHSNIPNRTSVASPSSPFPPEINISPPVDTTRASPHVEARVDDLNIDGPLSDTPTSSLPLPAGPHAVPVANTNIFPGAHHFVFNVQGDSNTVVQGMKALSKRVINGAEYDSSLRDPPPQCHPGTRLELLSNILTWFHDGGREKPLLWLNGPAGVGKSAVSQTVAESLAEFKSVGATLFFSRLDNRNDPQRVFTTIAFQLATRIPTYRNYITERIALDPRLLRRGMKDQFRIFIAEPFGNSGIGKGGGPLVILLDGLDECEGVDEQSRIVTLINEFVLEFPIAPLIWIITSRPEPHIVAAFNDKAVAPSHWSEYVPINSTQAYRDVEDYLHAGFKAMQERFPHLPSNWPNETQFLKLTNGTRGFFVIARTALRFMADPEYTDPVSRLNLLLSIIDQLDINVIDDHPFALLDALYTQILASVPSPVWCTIKRLLGFVSCVRPTEDGLEFRREFSSRFGDGLSYPLSSQSCSLGGASLILGLELSTTYISLHKLQSVLDIPDSQNAHQSRVTFLHASFGDYLTDRLRSKEFYIDRGEIIDEIAHGLFQLYLDKAWITEWERYTPQLSTVARSCLCSYLELDAESSLEYVLTGGLRSKRGRGPLKSQQDRSDCLDALSHINLVEVYGLEFHGAVATLLIELWNTFREELESTGRFKEVPLSDMRVDHLDYERNTPAFVYKETLVVEILDDFEPMKSKLQEHLMSYLGRPAMIYGSLPENSIAFVAGRYDDLEGYFCFPYPY